MKLIIVSAKWSSLCNNIEDLKERLVKNNDITIKEYDYDFDSEKIKYYNVGQMVPLFILLDNNDNEITRVMGKKSYDEINNLLEKYRVE